MNANLPDNVRLVFTNEQITEAIRALAERLNLQLVNESPVVLCVMQGGLVFAGQIIPQLNCMLDIDYIHATRYNNQTTGAEEIQWKAYPASELRNRCVLILDDILDEGHTLSAIIEYCESQGASRVYSAVLLRKNHIRCIDNEIMESSVTDNIALQVEDQYVFGYGMDFNGQYRQLDAIYAVNGGDAE